MRVFLIFIAFFTLPASGSECQVGGNAMWWAYDLCFAKHETDDSIHPSVISCTDKSKEIVEDIGSCKAKHEFKSELCKMRSENEAEFKHCMSHNISLGPSVRNGGI